MIQRKLLETDELINKINNHKINKLTPEFFINTLDEQEEATEVFSHFMNKLEDRSVKSNKDDEDFEDELIPDDTEEGDEKINKMVNAYYKEENISQSEVKTILNRFSWKIN